MSEETFERLHDYDAVDASAATERLVSFLAWVEQRPDVVARRHRSYELLRLRPGGRVADVGCGIGTVLLELAERGAEPVGVDVSEAMLVEAERRAPGSELHAADAARLPFPDGSLAGYRAERVFQHVADPGPAFAEALRVLEPGGRIVLVDQDWDAFIVDGDDRELTRAMLRGFADSVANGWAGRRNGLGLRAAGFVEVEVEAETVTWNEMNAFLPSLKDAALDAGLVDEAAADGWIAEQLRRAEEGRFFGAMTHFVTSATRP